MNSDNLTLNSTSGNLIFNPSSTGGMGMGTTTPLNKLDVKGGMAIGRYAEINTAPNNSIIVGGNVGIEVANPSNPLEVGGPGSPYTLDQSFTNGTYAITANVVIGQSFTAGVKGYLSQITVYPALNNTNTFTLTVYAGTGFSGAVLNTTLYSGYMASTLAIPLSAPVAVTAGQQYTSYGRL
jgi:hypothetical protein